MDVLTLVQNNGSYSRVITPVLVPIRGDATQTSGDMSKEKQNINPNAKDQNETFYLLYMSRRPRGSLLEKRANEGAPRSYPGQK